MLTLQHFYETHMLNLLHIYREEKEKKLYCTLQSKKTGSHCPSCGYISSRQHSRYGRMAKDLPFIDYEVELRIIARKFFCDVPSCEQRIFTERGISLLKPYSRRTNRVDQKSRSIAFSTNAEQGSRLSVQMNIPASADTLLRLIRKTPVESVSLSSAVGIDEWAYLKRHRYGVLICDLHTHRPIGLLEELSSDAVRQWLDNHKHIKLVTRDGSYKFKQAIQESQQAVTQVTDRWHLIQNFNDMMERILPRSLMIGFQCAKVIRYRIRN